MHTDSEKKAEREEYERCLPHMSVSTVGLIIFLSNWAFECKQRGGVADDEVRLHCKQFLGRLVIGAGLLQKREPVDILIVADDDFVSPFPRPIGTDRKIGAFIVRYGPDMSLDFGDLQSFVANNPRARPRKLWWNELKDYVNEEGKVSLMDGLSALTTKVALKSLFNQVVIGISLQVERALGMLASGAIEDIKGTVGLSMEYEAAGAILDDAQRDHMLLEYVESSKRWTKGGQYFSMACDKGHSGSLPLMFSCLTTPGNVAIVMCPQVDRSYDDEAAKAPGITPSSSAAASSSEAPLRLNRQGRHQAWVIRYTGGSRPGSWRPVVMHRRGAKRWLLLTDNQLKVHVTSDPSGWAYFVPGDGDEWKNVFDWPFIGCARDLGSDGLAASMALLYHFKVNGVFYDDFSHGASCDLKSCLKSSGVMNMFILILCSMNLPYGYESDEMRRQQLRECMEHTFATETHETCYLYKVFFTRLLEEWRRSGKTLPGDAPPEEELWEALKERSRVAKPAYRKATMCRFQDLHSAAEANYEFWTIDLWERTTLAVDQDMLKGRTFTQLVTKTIADEAGEHAASTSSRRIKVDERVLKSCAQNCVAISVMVLESDENKKAVGFFLAVAGPVKRWRQNQNKQLRQSENACKWLVSQIGDAAYMKHVREVLAQLKSQAVLSDTGFVIDASIANNAANGDAIDQDFYADMFAQMSLHMASARVRRGLWAIAGWPLRMTGALKSEADAQMNIQKFRDDVETYEKYLEESGDSAKDKVIKKRSCMQFTANRQLLLALQQTNNQATDAFKSMLSKRVTGVISTQVVEDFVGAAKNDPNTKTARKFRKPETAMAQIIGNEVLETRHKYKVLSMESRNPELSAKLAPQCFRPPMARGSLKFEEVCTTASSPSWFSPSATNVNTPYADLALLRDARASGSFANIRSAGAGACCEVAHKFVFCIRDSDDSAPSDDDRWRFAMWQWPDSACLTWPVTKRAAVGSGDIWFDFDLELKEPELVSLFSLSGAFAREITWRSWLWQYQTFPLCLPVSIKAFAGPEMLLKTLAAKKAFWSMSKSDIRDFCKHVGVAASDSASLYQVLYSAVSGILGAEDDVVLDIMSQRLADNEMCNAFSEAMQDVDSAMEVLDAGDKEAALNQKKAAETRLCAREEYKKEFMEEMKKFRLARENQKPKRARKAGPSERQPLPAKISQAQAKRFIPPGTAIWKGNLNGSWQGHRKPYKRVYEPWARSSEEIAMRRVISTLWRQYADKNGMSLEEIPYTGLGD